MCFILRCRTTNLTTSEELRFVQFMKNTAYHPGIKSTKYEALFDSKPKVIVFFTRGFKRLKYRRVARKK